VRGWCAAQWLNSLNRFHQAVQTTIGAEDEAQLQAMLDEADKTTWPDSRWTCP
jgi:hypothetical protein